MNTWKKNRKTIKIVCENCNIEFEKTVSEYKRSEKLKRKHFCSLNCNNKYRKPELKYCKQCGIEIKSKIFCSSSCAAKFNNRNRKGEKRNFSKEGIKNIRIALNNRLRNNRLDINNKIIEYNKNPKTCKQCDKIMPYKKRKNVFCDINCKRIYDRKNLTEYQKYYRCCQFEFGLSDYPNEFNFKLIKTHGWYQAKNHGNNLNGISRDHMISIKYGYENNINSEIIKHPANCQLMIHNENVSKYKNCSISLNELNKKINNWNLKYNL